MLCCPPFKQDKCRNITSLVQVLETTADRDLGTTVHLDQGTRAVLDQNAKVDEGSNMALDHGSMVVFVHVAQVLDPKADLVHKTVAHGTETDVVVDHENSRAPSLDLDAEKLRVK